MKNIKRIITSFILVFSILFLSACGGVKSKTYYIEKDGREITVKVKHKDDNVLNLRLIMLKKILN